MFQRPLTEERLLETVLKSFTYLRAFTTASQQKDLLPVWPLLFRQVLILFAGLNLVSKLLEHKKTEKKVEICKERLLEGDNFAEALKEAAIFSNVNNRMVAVGFKTGEIDKVMTKIADEYEKKAERKINEIISVIEPTLVIILSIIVGLILLSVILPLMGIMTTIG